MWWYMMLIGGAIVNTVLFGWVTGISVAVAMHFGAHAYDCIGPLGRMGLYTHRYLRAAIHTTIAVGALVVGVFIDL
ncbi:hypothetical protein LCGC14_0787600 [marine sediment metagenome]|uniref:Uncharacterized protein n=1 Tax=marine sediment metagenome TaxID=412755 RepID=A0A0F9PXU4_9ZZZZ